MKIIKKVFRLIQKNNNFKYFAVLSVLCFAIVGVFRPIVQRSLETQTVSASPAKAKKNLPIYSVKTDEQRVAISFDAAWGADDTGDILKTLKDHDVKATFFLCGYWVDEYPTEVKMIYDAGHEIGNHSSTHPHVAQLSLEQNKNEIMEVHKKVKEITGYDMNLYRAPFGEYNDTVLNAAKEVGYHTIQWDVDSLDWKEHGVSQQITQVLDHKHLGAGSIMLFHNDAKYTPDALDDILNGLKEKGYTIGSVGELIHTDSYYMDHEGRQHIKTAEMLTEE